MNTRRPLRRARPQLPERPHRSRELPAACCRARTRGVRRRDTRDARPPPPGGTLKAALTGEPDMLDPTRSQIYTGAQVYDNIFSKLIDIDEHQKFYGVLAKSWKQVNPKTWVFDLVRREVPQRRRVHRERRRSTRSSGSRTRRPRAATRRCTRRSSSIEVNSPTRVTFHLSTPFGPFLTNLANNGEIVNKRSVEAKGSERKPVGTGPFQFVEWKQGDHITLKRFPGYFKKGQPSLDGVAFHFLLVDQGRIDALHSGQLDWVDAVPLQQLATLAKDPQLTLLPLEARGHPRLPRAERRARSRSTTCAAAGRRLGDRSRRDPGRRLLRRGRGRAARGADRLGLVLGRRRAVRQARPRQGQGAR